MSSPEALEDLAEHYRAKGYTVLNIPSPSGKGLGGPDYRMEETGGKGGWTGPGGSSAIKYFEANVPPGSVVIGHSWGGNHVEEWAQHNEREGILDTNQYITIGGAFQDPDEDGEANIKRFGANFDPVVNWQNPAGTYDGTFDGGHSSSNWEAWIPHIDGAINSAQISNGSLLAQERLKALYGHDPDKTGTYRWGE